MSVKGKERATSADMDDVDVKPSAPDQVGPPTRIIHRQQWTPSRVFDYPQPPTAEEIALEAARQEAAAAYANEYKEYRTRARRKERRTVDYYGSIERAKFLRSTRTSAFDQEVLRPQPNYVIELLPADAYPTNSSTSIASRYVHTSTNKNRSPINVVLWTPEGRRLLTGATSGEFTLWNGLTFNFETILSAHSHALRGADWSTSGIWLVAGFNNGEIKYFQTNMNNLASFKGHEEPIRDVSFAPNDARFATGSDDKTIKLWDFERQTEERTLNGHLWDVKTVKWHQSKGLLASGGKDSLIKFWDPRTGKSLATLQEYHKNTVQALAWNPNGHSLASVSRDSFVKVFDIRAMKELQTFRGHEKEVCSVAWHPFHHDYLATGGSDGAIIHWLVGHPAPVDNVQFAHDSNVWSLAFHPIGHLLASGSNDFSTRFWSRARPAGRLLQDRWHVGVARSKELGHQDDHDDDDDLPLPGLQQPGPPMHHGGGGGYSGGYGNPGAIPGFGGPARGSGGGGGYQQNRGGTGPMRTGANTGPLGRSRW